MSKKPGKGTRLSFKDYVTTVEVADVEFDEEAKKIKSATASFVTKGFVAGMLAYTDSTLNPGPFYISAVSASELTIEAKTGTNLPVQEGSPAAVTATITGELVVDGVENIDGPSPSRKEIDMSHLSSEIVDKDVGILDPGQVKFGLRLNFADAGQARLRDLLDSAAADSYRVSYPDGSSTTFDAKVLDFGVKAGGHDDPLEGSATLTLTSAPVTDEADA